MNASKENAQKATLELDKVWDALAPRFSDEILFVRNFLSATQKKLPTEQSYRKDKNRRKAILKGA